MPLGIPADAVPQESPELAAFKAQVQEVAQRYAKQHNMCSVVDKALAEAGVTKKLKPVRGKATVTLEYEITFAVSPDLVAGLSPEEEEAILGPLLLAVTVNGARDSRFATIKTENKTTPESLVVSSIDPVVELSYNNIPDGYTFRYVSDTGRVRHIVAESGSVWRTALCGSSGAWVESSYRSTGDTCIKCREQADRAMARGTALPIGA